ncbi:ribosome silencing factor [Paraliomyxa miuraensis]|uniref:ribosome silencing factor n=1 Tax=Paraliomyxa miuraensis TaxID=376150 RepID=UPI0022573EB9|nr:ribosome silencing factor [Paraliomyxa miuraensis]MCX4243219.1 ribosome silencing factor [Paraliomyxa miuraensis]
MTSSSSTTWSPRDLPTELRTALDAALDKKALAPAVMRVTELAGYTDWVMILSARSERQVAAIAEAIVRALKGHGVRPRGTDGFEGHQWDLLDYDDFIVHVFHHPVRTHFDLESMWSDAPRVELGLPPEVMDTSSLQDVFAPTPSARPEYHGDVRFGGFDDEFDDDGDEFDDDDGDGDGDGEALEGDEDEYDDALDDDGSDEPGDDADDEWADELPADEAEDVTPA